MKSSPLTLEQHAFCKYYTDDSTAFGNATLAYALSHDIDLDSFSRNNELGKNGLEIPDSSEYRRQYNYCSMAGSRMIRIDKVAAQIQSLMASKIDDDKVADARLMTIILNGKDSDALRAIRHRNELKQRVAQKLISIQDESRPLPTPIFNIQETKEELDNKFSSTVTMIEHTETMPAEVRGTSSVCRT